MLKTSPTSVKQSLKDLEDNKFGKDDYVEDKARIPFVSFASKDPTGADYLTSGAKKAFNLLQHTFIQAPIFQHFDMERYIWIEINTSSYAICEVLSQLTLNDLGQCYLIVYYLRKMISAKI